MKDIEIIRELAKNYAQFALSEKNKEKMDLMRGVNGLKPIRPAVYINELPWHELDIDRELTLQCTGDIYRGFENALRKNIFQHKHFPADTVFVPYISVSKIIHSTGKGMEADEDVISIDAKNHIIAHKYHDQLKTEEDLAKLQIPEITYDEAESLKRLEFAEELFKDILPVKLEGHELGFAPWDEISRFRGVGPLLTDLAIRPEFMHKVIGRFHEIAEAVAAQYEALGVLKANAYYVHCTAGLCDELSLEDGKKATPKNMWGRGTAQIFSSVSPDMHYEFDISYMMRYMEKFGLVYYGCCEPLHDRIDKVAKIPNLRKVSITPWANIEQAAEAIGNKYVFAAKPNPAFVAESSFDAERVRKEILTVLDACKKNGTTCEFVLKDISTCGYRPDNIFKWEKTVMETVVNYM